MTESPFDRISQNLLEVSNRPEDLDWVQVAFGMLLKENVRPSRAESAIKGCIRALADTGESAHQLFCDPSEWVLQKTANWRQKGTQAFELNEPMNWWWSCLLSFFGAAKTSVLFWLYCLLWECLPSLFFSTSWCLRLLIVREKVTTTPPTSMPGLERLEQS